jgi:hypothetical protein
MESDTCELILKQSIRHALDSFNYPTALFLSERLVTIAPDNQDHVYLLAKTNYLMNNKNQALALLDPTVCPHNSIILYGNCCLDLQKYREGEISLRKWIETHMETNQLDLSIIHSLLGTICK